MRASILCALLLLGLSACDGDFLDPDPDRSETFRIRTPFEFLLPSGFQIRIEDPESIQAARALASSGEGRWVVGRLRPGNGGFNAPWSWHLDPEDPAGIHFPEVTIEECQATVNYIQDNLQDWLQRQNLTCIWGKVERL